jgi:hypothetical protein
VRELLGGGLRLDVARGADGVLGAGVSAMYEHELRTDESRSETWRLSTFLDFRRELKDYLQLLLVGWYQPNTRDFADFRASLVADLEIDLAGPLGLVVWGSWERDSRPPSGVEETDWTLRTGLRVSL